MGSAVKVYGVVASPFVATVLLCLEETGTDYELVPLDMAALEHRSEPHLSRSVSSACLNGYDSHAQLFVSCNLSFTGLIKISPFNTVHSAHSISLVISAAVVLFIWFLHICRSKRILKPVFVMFSFIFLSLHLFLAAFR